MFIFPLPVTGGWTGKGTRLNPEEKMLIPEDRYIKVGSINTRYLAEGASYPVILLHGMGGSASGWLPAFGAFADHYRVYAMDLPGHGCSDRGEGISLDSVSLAGFVKDFMEEFKIEQAHVLGHSMGGAIALQLALDHPELVNKLVLVDSTGFGRELTVLFRIVSLPVLGEWLAARDYRSNMEKYAAATR
jgi:pimeloyl-ACP methyl ester carboxylesterase